MNEKPSNVLIRVVEGVGFDVTELPESKLPPEHYEWLTKPDDPPAIQQAAREQRRDLAAVFAYFFVATLAVLFLLGVWIGKVLL